MIKWLVLALLLLPNSVSAERWAYFGEDTPWIDLDTMSLGKGLYAYRIMWRKEESISTGIYVVDCEKKVFAHIHTDSSDRSFTTGNALTFSDTWYSSSIHSYIDDFICP